MELPDFLIRVLKPTSEMEDINGYTKIIIRRPYASLEDELQSVFKGQKDVLVKVDSRYGERRTHTRTVSSDRRETNRRRSKNEIIQLILSY